MHDQPLATIGEPLASLREQTGIFSQFAVPATGVGRVATEFAEAHQRQVANQIALALRPDTSALDTLMTVNSVLDVWRTSSFATSFKTQAIPSPAASFKTQAIPSLAASFKQRAGLDLSNSTHAAFPSIPGAALAGLRDAFKSPHPISLHPFASHGVRAIGALNLTDLAEVRNALGLWRGLGEGRLSERLALAFARSSAARLGRNLTARARAVLQWGLRNWGRFLTLLRLAGTAAGFLSAWSSCVVRRPRRFGRLTSTLCHLTFSIQRHGPPLCLA